FSTRSDIPHLPYTSPHVRYAYTGYIKHQMAQYTATLTQTLGQYGKYIAKGLPGVRWVRQAIARTAQRRR
ncbi:MAG: hypothetical protein WBA10_04580, partial [Elainellaceae cyanobacterium]